MEKYNKWMYRINIVHSVGTIKKVFNDGPNRFTTRSSSNISRAGLPEICFTYTLRFWLQLVHKTADNLQEDHCPLNINLYGKCSEQTAQNTTMKHILHPKQISCSLNETKGSNHVITAAL
jgi:hypothetical protein